MMIINSIKTEVLKCSTHTPLQRNLRQLRLQTQEPGEDGMIRADSKGSQKRNSESHLLF